MKTARWIVMGWGTATVLVLVYYSSRWLFETNHPLRAEFLVGVSLSLLAGSLAWLVLPAMAWRARLSGSLERWALSTPSLLAVLCLLLLAVKGGL